MFYSTGGILFNYFSGLLFNYIIHFEEAVQFTGMSKSYMYKLTSAHKIPHYKPSGKMVYFNRNELQAWLLQNKVSTHDELESKALAYCLK